MIRHIASLAFALVVALPVAARAQNVPFQDAVVDASRSGDAKAIGDLNGDGFADLIIGGTAGIEPLVWYKYPSWTRYNIASPLEAFTADIQLGDVDGDGDLDIIAADGAGANNLVWFENPRPFSATEDGIWLRHSFGSHACYVNDIEVADIDHDGRLDVITRASTNCGSLYLRIWFQDTPYSWTVRDLSITAGPGEGLGIGDVNRDGYVDIICGGAWLQCPANPRTGTWTRHSIVAPWTNDLTAAVADFNGDGRPDVAMISQHGRGKFSWFQGPADPTTGAWTERVISTNTGSRKLNVADFNGDGRPDFQTALEQQEVAIFRNQTGAVPTFAKQVLDFAGENLRVADIGNDGDIDIFGSNSSSNGPVRLWVNNLFVKVELPVISPDGGTFLTPPLVTMSCSTTGAVVRYTTDGSDPTATSPVGTNLTIQYTTTLRARAFLSGQTPSDIKTSVFTMSDVDGDGLPDWVETGTGIYVSPTNTGTSLADPDTDHDGRSDFVEVYQGTDPFNPNSFPRNFQADFNGDGVSDITVCYRQASTWYSLYSGGGSLQLQWGWSQTVPAPGDYDGDGKTDIAVFHPGSGNWYIRQSSNSALRQLNFGWSQVVPVPADYDGDQRTDVAVYYPQGGMWYILQSSNSQIRVLNWGWSAAKPVPADYDGDGKADIAVYHQDSGTWYILQSSNNAMRVLNWGWSDAYAVPGDYDGDRKADIAVYNQKGGWWYILQSSSGVLRQQYFGWYDAKAVPGDYDGDGRTDLAVYWQNSGNWYILRSTAGYQFQNWGWSQAEPVIGPRN